MDENEIRRKAIKRVKAKKGFIMHLVVFIAVMALLFFINATITPGFNWSTIVLLGWGIGLASHFVSVYGFFGIGGHDWEEIELEREMLKLDPRSRTENEEGLELEDPRELERRWDEDELV